MTDGANISICIFWGKGESNKGRSSVTKLQLYLRICGTCLCFFEVAGDFVFKIRTCKVKPGWIEKSISKFWTRCVISLCFDVELLQNLLEASTLPLIYSRMSHSREAFCRRGVSTFHRKGFSKGWFQVRGSQLRYGCSVMVAACGGKKIDNRDIGRWMRWALLSSWKVSCGWSGIGCKKRGLIWRENGGICAHCA